MTKTTINIAKQFSRTPGARYRSDGEFSGEAFREEYLVPAMNEHPGGMVEVVLDGTRGFATSFLEEAFGGLARKFGADACLARLRFVSDEDGLLEEEIREYIREASKE